MLERRGKMRDRERFLGRKLPCSRCCASSEQPMFFLFFFFFGTRHREDGRCRPRCVKKSQRHARGVPPNWDLGSEVWSSHLQSLHKPAGKLARSENTGLIFKHPGDKESVIERRGDVFGISQVREAD